MAAGLHAVLATRTGAGRLATQGWRRSRLALPHVALSSVVPQRSPQSSEQLPGQVPRVSAILQ